MCHILLSIDTSFMDDIDWPGELVEWHVGRGVVDQPIYPRVDAWVVDPSTKVDNRALSFLPHLEVIVTASTGTNHIDIDDLGIAVYSLLDDRDALAEIRASSEFTFLLMLMVLRNAHIGIEEVKLGRWKENERLLRGNELYGKTVGIIGLGRIGSNIARWCSAFGVERVLVCDPELGHPDLDTVMSESDVIVVSCSLNESTKDLISYRKLCKIRENCTLINTSRGEVIVEDDLARLLLKRPDIRVGIDVLRGEVYGAHLTSPLRQFNNVVITPHMAGLTYESNEKAARIAADLLRRHYDEYDDREGSRTVLQGSEEEAEEVREVLRGYQSIKKKLERIWRNRCRR